MKISMAVFSVTFTLAVLMASVFADDATEFDFMKLYDDLLGNYSRHVRPLVNQSASIPVSVQFDLLSVSDIDDVKQRISVLAVVTVQWKDKNLKWNPSQYGGIDRMYFSEEQIWAPMVYIEESQTKGPTLFNLPTNHLVLPDGTVTFISSGILETSCSLDMTYFPYDFQSCKFGFGVLNSSKKDIELVPDPLGPQKSSTFVQDGEWSVYDFGVALRDNGKPNYEFPTLHVILKLQRRSTYYVLNVIVPSVTVSFLSLITFAVPVESGERLAYALTNLLSLAVYITYIGSIMPSSSVDLPIILRYLVSLFLISSMCVVMTVVVITVRWSKIIRISDQCKAIYIFGLPIRFRNRHKYCRNLKNNHAHKKCLEKIQSISTESTSVCSELQSLCESPKDKTDLEETGNMKEPNKQHNRPNVSTSIVNNNTKQADLNKKKFPLVNDIPRGLKDYGDELNLTTPDIDPDVIHICSRIDLVSFCLLLLSFFVMSIQSFVELMGQTPI